MLGALILGILVGEMLGIEDGLQASLVKNLNNASLVTLKLEAGLVLYVGLWCHRFCFALAPWQFSVRFRTA